MSASLARMTIAEAELVTALDQLERLVDVMRRADPEYCAVHRIGPSDDEEWDEVLAEAEDYLEEMREEGRL